MQQQDSRLVRKQLLWGDESKFRYMFCGSDYWEMTDEALWEMMEAYAKSVAQPDPPLVAAKAMPKRQP